MTVVQLVHSSLSPSSLQLPRPGCGGVCDEGGCAPVGHGGGCGGVCDEGGCAPVGHGGGCAPVCHEGGCGPVGGDVWEVKRRPRSVGCSA